LDDGSDVILRIVLVVDVVVPLTSNSMVGDGMDSMMYIIIASKAVANIRTLNLMVISY